jgi:hypothetical protein
MVLTLGGGGGEAQVSGLGSGLADGNVMGNRNLPSAEKAETKTNQTKLVNRAAESRSPYVRTVSSFGRRINHSFAWDTLRERIADASHSVERSTTDSFSL